MPLKNAMAYEQGDLLYLVAPVTPYTPTKSEIEEYAFGGAAESIAGQASDSAPNPMIQWFSGHYVEADRPNLNGAMWLGTDLAIASLTPVMMPVTVMHDPRTAVGVIANAILRMPGPGIPRAKIDTALATWKHRFPEAVDEALYNYEKGSLMQSMECLAPSYDCSICGMHFVKLPKSAEKANWCEHLVASDPSAGYSASADAENSNASRILRGVTFTGTGLIFGSRGATGADPEANLEAFQAEVAEFHARAHRDTKTTKSKSKSRSKTTMEIEDREYERLVKERDDAKASVATLTNDLSAATRKVEETEAALATSKEETEAEKAKVTAAEAEKTKLEEQANAQTLRDERFEALGSAFREKIDSMPTTKANLLKDAAEMQDEAWGTRLSEVEETTGTKRDAVKANEEKPEKKDGLFEKEEVARFGGGGGSQTETTTVKEPTAAERRSIVGSLSRKPEKKAS